MLDRLNETLSELIERASEGIEAGWYNFCEMADPTSEIKQKILDKTPQIVEHLYKILVYGEQPKYKFTIHHWVSEIRAALRQFCAINTKATNKPLSVNTIVKTMISKYTTPNELYCIVDECCEEYGEVILDIDKIYNQIITILPKIVEYAQTNIPMNVNRLQEIILGEKRRN